MMNKNFRLTSAALLIMIAVSGCVNLKEINDYSSKSSTGIKKFEDINYSFELHCLDRCQFEAIRTFAIKKEPECDCDIYRTADSVTLLIYNSIKGYFDGLTNLSDNELTTYDFDALQKVLSEEDLGSIKIEEADVKAYTSISKILLRATTDLYRKKKLKEYIEQANGPIQILLQKFQFIIQKNLEDALTFKMNKLYYYYGAMVKESNNDYEKSKMVIEYYQQLSEVNQMKKLIDAYAKGLQSIATGHQKLYDKRNKLTTKEVKELVKHYSSDIQDIISEFNKLKNK